MRFQTSLDRLHDGQAQPSEDFPEHFEEVGEQEVFAPTTQSVSEQSSGEAQQEELSQDQRLERAYQVLKAEGRKPSGRALAERAHIHRSTCNAWLKAHTPKKPLTDRNVLYDDTDHQEQEK